MQPPTSSCDVGPMSAFESLHAFLTYAAQELISSSEEVSKKE